VVIEDTEWGIGASQLRSAEDIGCVGGSQKTIV
jgi:hypothetical protein